MPELAEHPGLEEVEEVLTIEVATDGTVTITPDEAVEGQVMDPPVARGRR